MFGWSADLLHAHSSLGYNELDFFVENEEPMMDAKLKSKKHLQFTF
jgi:hypothetical protein